MQAGRVVGAAIVAPPLYAPLPYVNSSPESVFMGEVLLPGEPGGDVTLAVPAHGQAARGSGIGMLEVSQRCGQYCITFERELRDYEEAGPGRTRFLSAEIRF